MPFLYDPLVATKSRSRRWGSADIISAMHRTRALRSLDVATALAVKEQRMGEQLESVFDYVVVGGGLAGCAVAARLSENPDARVVLIEAGDENRYEQSNY